MPAFRSGSIGPTTVGVDTTFTAPTGIQNGDVLLAIFRVASDPDAPKVTPPAGFQSISRFPLNLHLPPDTTDAGLELWVKIANSESGNYTFSHASAGRTGYMYCISGPPNAVRPLNPHPTVNEGVGATVTATGLTTPADNTFVIFCSYIWHSHGTPLTAPSGATPTFTERYNSVDSLYLADGVLATAGATGDKTLASGQAADGSYYGILISVTDAVPPIEPTRFLPYRC